jgi:hypothetical protein
MRHPFDPSVMVGDDHPLSADAKVDAAAPVRLGRAAGLLGDDRLHRHDQPAAALAQGHRQDARPTLAPLRRPALASDQLWSAFTRSAISDA